MSEVQTGESTNVILLAGITILTCVLIHFIYRIVFGSKKKKALDHETESNLDAGIESEETTSKTTATESQPSTKSKKRAQWKTKTEFTHPWLLKNLKGHPGTVLHADISANGKFMAATCDVPIPMADAASDPARRRKQRCRRCTPPAPASLSTILNISNEELVKALQPHLLSQERRWALGYPLELDPLSTKAVIYISPPPISKTTIFTALDVNAPEFIPGDSGRGSWGSSPRSDSDEEADAVEHSCARCDRRFRITREGEYITEEPCVYHWGRISIDSRYACCKKVRGAKGCSFARFHVWNGTRPGMNGPFEGYVRARSPRGGVYAIDAEMCYTTAGLELASIAVVAADGRVVYKTLVRPTSEVVDCNTRFSGIRLRDLLRATKTLRDVQNDILGFIGTDTILIGHSLDNDLRALKLLHSAVVDTCALYPHARGFPMRRSLRALTQELLGRTIQCTSTGHSPIEDARAAMDLVLLKVHEERANNTHFSQELPVLQPYEPLICDI